MWVFLTPSQKRNPDWLELQERSPTLADYTVLRSSEEHRQTQWKSQMTSTLVSRSTDATFRNWVLSSRWASVSYSASLLLNSAISCSSFSINPCASSNSICSFAFIISVTSKHSASMDWISPLKIFSVSSTAAWAELCYTTTVMSPRTSLCIMGVFLMKDYKLIHTKVSIKIFHLLAVIDSPWERVQRDSDPVALSRASFWPAGISSVTV